MKKYDDVPLLRFHLLSSYSFKVLISSLFYRRQIS